MAGEVYERSEKEENDEELRLVNFRGGILNWRRIQGGVLATWMRGKKREFVWERKWWDRKCVGERKWEKEILE